MRAFFPARSWSLGALLMLVIAALHPVVAARPAAGRSTAARVDYEILYGGQVVPDEGRIQLECGTQYARVQQQPPGERIPGAPRETGYLDYGARRSCQILDAKGGARSAVLTDFSTLPVLEPTDETAEILGFPCRKAVATLRSNRLEIWFTKETTLRGGPSLNLLVPDGLVLKIVRNGDYEIRARELTPLKTLEDPWPVELGEVVDAAEFRARVTAGWITTVPVFEHEQVCFTPAAVDTTAMRATLRAALAADSSAVLRFAAGTLLLRKVELPRLASATVFLELSERSRGDAYDRTGSVFLLPTQRAHSLLDALLGGVSALPAISGRDGRRYQGLAATEDYLPPLELMRFITPFGVGHYNGQVQVKGQSWADSALYKMDVSALLPALQGSVWLGAFVGNYDAGGHEVDLRLVYHPDNREVTPPPAEEGWCLPLFNTVNVLEMAGQEYGRLFERDTLGVEFELPAGVTDLRLRYTSTGHGGWGGGDEFNPKINTLLLDGQPLASVTPWRSDCASFRRLNPASGNFWNGVSSSDLSRSGWCPGAAAEPVTIALPELAPGRHRLQVAIPQGAPEGESFSAWNVSGVLLGTRPRP